MSKHNRNKSSSSRIRVIARGEDACGFHSPFVSVLFSGEGGLILKGVIC